MAALATDFRITDEDYRILRDVVYTHCGIALGDDKQAMVKARLAKRIRMQGFDSATQYLEFALSDRKSEAFAGLIDAITTNLTSFFREAEHFNYLTNTALPALLSRKAASGDGRLLVWSAACSSGEEPYTIAMTILEATERSKLGRQKIDLRILATDISTQMLSQARAGIYESDRLASVPPRLRNKYFTEVAPSAKSDGQLVVTPVLRSLIQFRSLNLINSWPFRGPFDFVFCRNVMIYFDQATQQALVDRLWACLRPGGVLFTGHSESLTRISHRFTNRLPSIYEKSM